VSLQEEYTQREAFKKILKKLAKDASEFETSEARNEIFNELEDLYYDPDETKRFRHFYSDIFETLTEINSTEDGSAGSIQALTENLSSLRKVYTPERKDKDKNLIDISKELRKLDDHVSLDCARIDYSDKGDRELKKEPVIKEITKQIDESKKELEDSSVQIKSLKEQVKTSETALKDSSVQIKSLIEQVKASETALKDSSDDIETLKTQVQTTKDELDNSAINNLEFPSFFYNYMSLNASAMV